MPLTLSTVLEVEDTPEILEFRHPGSTDLLWPAVRQQFLRTILGDLLFGQPLVSAQPRHGIGRAARPILRTAAHNALHRCRLRGEVLIAASGAGHVVQGGRWVNRLSDHFAAVSPRNTVVLEDLFDMQWRHPRHNPRVLYRTPLQVASLIVGRARVGSRHRAAAREMVRFARDRAKRVLDWELGDEREVGLAAGLAQEMAQAPFARAAHARLLRRTGAKLLLKEEACYGGSALFNRVAREEGLVVAEYQHGVVSAGHDAYNVAPTLAASPAYRAGLPDYLLTYGTWWGRDASVPVKRVAVGNPHRSEVIAGLQPPASHAGRVVVLGDGIDTKRYLALAGELAAHLPAGMELLFRPHPMERRALAPVGALALPAGVALDGNSDILETLRTAEVVVCEISTGLFDAIGLTPRIFVWETPKAQFQLPEHPFGRFADARDLVRQLPEPDAGRMTTADVNEIWAPNWRDNYRAFLASVHVGA